MQVGVGTDGEGVSGLKQEGLEAIRFKMCLEKHRYQALDVKVR